MIANFIDTLHHLVSSWLQTLSFQGLQLLAMDQLKEQLQRLRFDPDSSYWVFLADKDKEPDGNGSQKNTTTPVETIPALHSPGQTLTALMNRTARHRIVYLSRHGESEFNVYGRVGGDSDLSAHGRKYAEALARYFNMHIIPQCTDAELKVWTSCLKRTIQTAQGIKAPQERLSALNELNAGICDGMTYEEIADRYPQELAARDADKYGYRYPGGESYADLLDRAQPVLWRLAGETNVFIVAHQAVIRCLLAALTHTSKDELPYIHAPLHTVMRVTLSPSGQYHLDLTPLRIACVDTYRAKPVNCSRNRTRDEALVTLPAHF